MSIDNNILKKTEEIIDDYLKNNEFAEIDQFYDYYINELLNINPKSIPNKSEIKQFLKEKRNLEYDQNRDIFWLKFQSFEKTDLKKYEILSNLYNWNVIFNVNLVISTPLIKLRDLEGEIKERIKKYDKMTFQKMGPFLTIIWDNDDLFVEIKIRERTLDIISYYPEKKRKVYDLLEYVLNRNLENIQLKKILLLIPQISGAFTAYQIISKELLNIYNKSISFEIKRIKINTGYHK